MPGGCRLLRIDAPGEALRERYLGQARRAVYLIRPDQHVCARWSDASDIDLAQRARSRDRECGHMKALITARNMRTPTGYMTCCLPRMRASARTKATR